MSRVVESVAIAEIRRLFTSWLEDAHPRFLAASGGVDLVVQAERLRFVVEYKGSGDASAVAAAIKQAKAFAEKAGKDVTAIVAVPFMGDVGKTLCAAAGVSWLDLSGNARVVAPRLRVLIEGRPNKFPRRGRPSTAFAPKSARIARRLLIDPRRSFRQQELAHETGLDDGFTSRIVRRLQEDGLLARAENGTVRCVDPGLLLDAWTEVYDFSKHNVIRGHVNAKSGDELLLHLERSFKRQKLRHAATGLAGAWVHTQHAAFRLATVFVELLPEPALLQEMGFREEPRGANVWLVVPNDMGVFDGASQTRHVAVVHPVQAYLDLLGQPERAKEAREELRARCLRWGSGHGKADKRGRIS